MTAPVIRFGSRLPVSDVMMIRAEVMLIESEMPRRIPSIIDPWKYFPWSCTLLSW
jgi:hypothetical protein